MSDDKEWIVPKTGYLDPQTPAEYLEAIRRFVEVFMDNWGKLPDGDGVTQSPDDATQTKTDMFLVISGCCQYALDNIRDFHDMTKGVNL